MTIFEWQAHTIAEMGKQLAHVLETTQTDRLEWRPSADPESKARCAFDVAAECIDVNRRFAALLRDETPPPPSFAWPFVNAQEAYQQIRDSALELAEAVRRLDESAMSRGYATGRGALTGSVILTLAAAHLSYHVGQLICTVSDNGLDIKFESFLPTL